MKLRPPQSATLDRWRALSQGTAEHSDRLWFAQNSLRRYHARPSLPLEYASWGPDSHKHWNWSLIRADFAMAVYDRMPMHAQDGIIDDEIFLATIWHMSAAGGGTMDVSPEFHAALLEARGHEVSRG